MRPVTKLGPQLFVNRHGLFWVGVIFFEEEAGMIISCNERDIDIQ